MKLKAGINDRFGIVNDVWPDGNPTVPRPIANSEETSRHLEGL
jgi:hypothetical protein